MSRNAEQMFRNVMAEFGINPDDFPEVQLPGPDTPLPPTNATLHVLAQDANYGTPERKLIMLAGCRGSRENQPVNINGSGRTRPVGTSTSTAAAAAHSWGKADMTFPPEKIGDKGQRYEVRVTGYPKDEESVIGWANDKQGAHDMGLALGTAPGALMMRIVDRTGVEPDFTRYFGVLR